VKKLTEEANEPYTEAIHPAIDFTENHAYVGQMVPESKTKRSLFLIRDDGKISLGTEFELQNIEFEQVCSRLELGKRWSYQSIIRFSKGEAPAIEKTQILSQVREQLSKYIELRDERLYDFLALWSIGTYFFPIFNSYPYVYVGGVSQSGKSKLLTLCSCICFNSILSATMSTAILYRIIQAGRCSLFIDEAGNLHDQNRAVDFRNLLYSGYRKGAKALRCSRNTDKNFVPDSFEVYGPKMLANIEGLEEVLESRCIEIIMRRGTSSIASTEIDMKDPVWQQIRDMIYTFLMQNWKAIKKIYSEMENDAVLKLRDWENWKPILSLAKFFDKDILYPKVRALAIEKVTQKQNAGSELHEYVLLEVLLSIVNKDGFYSLANIKRRMADLYDSDAWLTERFIGRLLRRLGFCNSKRMGTGYEYFITLADVKDLAQGFELSEGSECSEGNTGQGNQTETVIEEAVQKCQEEK